MRIFRLSNPTPVRPAITVLLLALSSGLGAPIRVNAQVGMPGFRENPVLSDVQAAVSKIATHPAKLAVGRNGQIPAGRLTGVHPTNHFQGIQRIKGGHFAVTASYRDPDDETKSTSYLFMVDVGSKDQIPIDVLRSNLLNPPDSSVLAPVPTSPPPSDVIAEAIEIDPHYSHAGGMSLAGEILAVPLESDFGSRIVFYNVEAPSNPIRIGSPVGQGSDLYSSDVVRDTLTETYTFDPFSAEPIDVPVGYYLKEYRYVITRKGGAVLLAKLPNDYYLLGVWSDSDSLEEYATLVHMDRPEEEEYHTASLPYPRRLDLYLSVEPDRLEFDSTAYYSLCSSPRDATNKTPLGYFGSRELEDYMEGKVPPIECDNLVNDDLDFPEPNYQTLNFLKEQDGKSEALYIAATRNTGIAGSGVWGEERLDLYRFSYSFDDPRHPAIADFHAQASPVSSKHLYCDKPSILMGDWCNFQAAASPYITFPERNELAVYSVPHYLDGELLKISEFRSQDSAAVIANDDLPSAWIELFKGSDFAADDNAWRMDYPDRALADYSDLTKVDSIGGGVSSVRWLLPTGYELSLYAQEGFKGPRRGLPGTGQIAGDPELTGAAGNPMAVKVNPETVSSVREGWIELYENVNFDGRRLRINGFDGSELADYQSLSASGVEVIELNGDGDAFPASVEGVGWPEPDNFNDLARSLRFHLPTGYVYRLYTEPGFDESHPSLYVDLVGEGDVVEIPDIGVVDFDGDGFVDDVAERISSSRFVCPEGALTPECAGPGVFVAKYFNNTLARGEPVVTELEGSQMLGFAEGLTHDWGRSSPAPGVNKDGFSVTWEGLVDLPKHRHRFTVTADDGMRLYLDGDVLIDTWGVPAPGVPVEVVVPVPAGRHRIFAEYYDAGGEALAQLSWEMRYERTDLVPEDDPANLLNTTSWGVAIDEQTIVLGNHGANDLGGASGAAYVFEKVGSSWLQVQKLQPEDLTTLSQFGVSVAIHQDTIAVGARGSFSPPGAAYVYEKRDGSWVQVQRFQALNSFPRDQFGEKVALHEGRLLIYQEESPFLGNMGLVFLYEPVAGEWQLVQELTRPEPDGGELFGFGLDLSRELPIVGSPQDHHSGVLHPTGLAYVYAWNGSEWEITQVLAPEEDAVTGYRHFGYDVAIDGSWLAVGEPGRRNPDDSNGRVHIYELRDGRFVEEEVISPTPEGSNLRIDRFGMAVAIQGGYLAVGLEIWDDKNGGRIGGVDIYKRLAAGTWALVARFQDDAYNFGRWIAMDGTTVVTLDEDAAVVLE